MATNFLELATTLKYIYRSQVATGKKLILRPDYFCLSVEILGGGGGGTPIPFSFQKNNRGWFGKFFFFLVPGVKNYPQRNQIQK